MKTNSLTTTLNQYDYSFESAIEKKDAELKELARKNAKHFAKRNLPSPIGDKLPPYIGEIRTGYEHLAAWAFQMLQPQTHFPQAKMDQDNFKEKEKHLDGEIKILEEENHHDEYELQNFHPGSIPLLLWTTGIGTLIISLGEVIFNAKSFQITGENLLFALVLSLSISFTIAVFSHLTAFLFKAARTRLKRLLIVICSLVLVICVFIALAIFRSRYLAGQQIQVSPTYFVIFNLFLFIVSSLLSFFILPSWAEIKENLRHIRLYSAVKKRNRKIRQLKEEKIMLKDEHAKNIKERVQLVHYSNYVAQRIRKMYWECIEIFKGTNLVYRTDRQTPDCFSLAVAEPDIDNITIAFISSNGIA